VDKRASSADISVQRFWYDSAGPVFYKQVKGLLGYGVPTSQLVFGSVSLLDVVALVPSPQLKPATMGSSLRTKNHLYRIGQRNRQCWIPDRKGEAGLCSSTTQRLCSMRGSAVDIWVSAIVDYISALTSHSAPIKGPEEPLLAWCALQKKQVCSNIHTKRMQNKTRIIPRWGTSNDFLPQ